MIRRLRSDCKERQGLMQLAQLLSPKTAMVEIGSHIGESADIFIQSGNVSHICCVDLWEKSDHDEVESEFQLVVDKYPGKIRKLKMSSISASKLFENNFFDFCYIDANHDYDCVLQDIKHWLPKIKADGIISGHDYLCPFPGVVRAVYEIFGKPTHVFCDSSWYVDLRRAKHIEV